MMKPEKRGRKKPPAPIGIPERGMLPPVSRKPGEPRYTIMPVSRTVGPRFVAEDVKAPKPAGDSTRVRRTRPEFQSKPRSVTPPNTPKGGGNISNRGMGNKKMAMSPEAKARYDERMKRLKAMRSKKAKKRPPFIVDKF
jgi:hypothetical protein